LSVRGIVNMSAVAVAEAQDRLAKGKAAHGRG
jgi:hypothetical protein